MNGQGVVIGTPGRPRLHAGEQLATDSAGLAERSGWPVRTVPGHPRAFTITTAPELTMAEVLPAGSP